MQQKRNKVQVYAFANRKGGVGKSTHAATTAAGLAARGYKVAIIDTDTQGSISALFGLPEEDGLHAALVQKVPLDQVVRFISQDAYIPADSNTQSGGVLYLLPSGGRTYSIAHDLNPGDQLFAFLHLTDTMAAWLDLDVIIVDTSPSISAFDSSIYMSVDGFIYVTECEKLSIDGVKVALKQLGTFSQYRQQYLGRNTNVIGVLPNKFRAKTNVHTFNLQDMANGLAQGIVWSPVMLRTIWTEATNLNELIFTYEPSGAAAREAWQVVDRVEMAVQQWQTIASV